VWNTRKNCGLVVGATRPRELRRIRTLAPEMPLLIPGIGAQGGDLRSAVRFGCDARGEMAVINASRSILYASTGDDFAEAARREAESLRAQIKRSTREAVRSLGQAKKTLPARIVRAGQEVTAFRPVMPEGAAVRPQGHTPGTNPHRDRPHHQPPRPIPPRSSRTPADLRGVPCEPAR